MRKMIILILLFVLAAFSLPASAKQAIEVVYGETYLCGDSFEVIMRGEPVFTTAITRSPGGSKNLQIKAGKYDILLEVRLQIRNLSPILYEGLAPESFTLVGYVRGRPVSYLPEMMTPFDYGPKRGYRMYDKMYYKNEPYAPLRNIDMILVYRIDPIVRDFEIHLNPQGAKGTATAYLDAEYPEMDLRPCDGILQITTVRNIDTGEITKYYR